MTSRGDVPNSLRENIFMLHMAINLRFGQLKFIFGDEDDDDVEPNNQYFELVEVRRLFRRFQDWAGHYPPVLLEEEYDKINSPRARNKRRELYQLYNKVYDVVTDLFDYCMDWDPEGPLRVFNGMTLLLGDTRRRIRSLNPRNRETCHFKRSCAKKLLKIASAIYQCERFQLELYDTPEYRYSIEDQENNDVDRPVYRMFPPGTFQEIRNEEHHQPAPFYDEHQQFPYGEGEAYSDNGNVHGNPTGYDGERARLNGLTNGLANGHTDGHTYGNLIELDDAVIGNLARHNIGDTNMDGVTNGLANGYTNGLTNEHMNGNFNGYNTGNINGNTNLGDRVNEIPNVSGTSASAVNSQLQPPPQLPVQFPPEPDHQPQWEWDSL